MRDDATIRRDATMWALVAELEAERTDVLGMQAYNEFTEDGTSYEEALFNQAAHRMRGIAKLLREV